MSDSSLGNAFDRFSGLSKVAQAEFGLTLPLSHMHVHAHA